jgi:hypothetical protein
MEKNDPRALQLEERLNSLSARISELERRIAALERNLTPSKPSGQQPAQPAQPQPKTGTGHSYLSRAISLAKRDYDRKYK